MTLPKIGSFAVVAISVLWFTPAAAQDENPTTPGAIPDPSTYQGSMELQRQSDQQDQQYREQQQSPSQQYYGGSSQQGYGSPSRQSYGAAPAGTWPSTRCFNRVADIRALAPLGSKIELGGVGSGQPTEFQRSRPTSPDKVLLRRWLSERHRCGLVELSEGSTPRQRFATNHWGWPMTEKLTIALINGRLTYGEFNHQRAVNSELSSRYMNRR